jgi:hypothetical protein
MKLTDEDADDILVIAKEILQMCVLADYHDDKFADFAYNTDHAMRAIIEIIEKPKYTIKKIFNRDV